MRDSSTISRGLYFEEFETGHKIITVGRTITETDLVNFAAYTGDYNQIHTDAEYSKGSVFGQRVAHGLLVLSIAMGLSVRTGFVEGTVMAFREIENWKFVKPVFINDTIHAELEVIETKAVRRIGGGSVKINTQVKNQHGDVVMKGLWVALLASRPQ